MRIRAAAGSRSAQRRLLGVQGDRAGRQAVKSTGVAPRGLEEKTQAAPGRLAKAELYAAIRRDHRGGRKRRETDGTDNVSWWTASKAVDSIWPEPGKKLPP
ncbi:hypothetical protein ABZT43_37635 [Streptomyces sp. NPDC005349]|uniref:hypothetical protein n=1 Tax=Streptomyces sp. NPDC005349 TaxID=3157037 RepID=UPI00339EC27B